MAVTEMKTNEDKKVELTITVDAETFGKAVDEVFKKNVKRMTVPGFRRGKAPRKMIEKLYGEGVFYEEAVNNTYPAAYDAAVEEKGIEPVDRADIEVLDVSKDGYSFKATVTVKPEVSIEGYKGIEVEKKVVEATDAEVDPLRPRRVLLRLPDPCVRDALHPRRRGLRRARLGGQRPQHPQGGRRDQEGVQMPGGKEGLLDRRGALRLPDQLGPYPLGGAPVAA